MRTKYFILILLASLSLLSGEEDFSKPSIVLNEAAKLTQSGNYDMALERHLWYHHHALEIEPSQSGVRLSFALSDWVNLAKVYRPALIELRKLQKELSDQLQKNMTDKIFYEYLSINSALSDELETISFVHSVGFQHPIVQKNLQRICEDIFTQDLNLELPKEIVNVDFVDSILFSNLRMLQSIFNEVYSTKEIRLYYINQYILDSNRLLQILIGKQNKELYRSARESIDFDLHRLKIEIPKSKFLDYPGVTIEDIKYPETQSVWSYRSKDVIVSPSDRTDKFLSVSFELTFSKETKVKSDFAHSFNDYFIEYDLAVATLKVMQNYSYQDLQMESIREGMKSKIIQELGKRLNTKAWPIKSLKFESLIFFE